MPSPSRAIEMIQASNAGRARKRRKVDPAVKAKRIAAYRERCEDLRAKQAGGVNLAAESIRAEEAAVVARVEQARSFVSVALAGPHGDRLRKWMGPQGLKGDACRVALVVRNWAATQGVRLD